MGVLGDVERHFILFFACGAVDLFLLFNLMCHNREKISKCELTGRLYSLQSQWPDLENL